jgi:uncharacterized Zn finger protein (UPF0148 family)
MTARCGDNSHILAKSTINMNTHSSTTMESPAEATTIVNQPVMETPTNDEDAPLISFDTTTLSPMTTYAPTHSPTHLPIIPPTTPPTIIPTSNDLKDIARKRKAVEDMKDITKANLEAFRKATKEYKQVVSPPDRKPFIKISDDMKSALMPGEYVMVEGDTSPGKNRPKGYGYVVEVAGVGAATICSVKFEKAFDGGRLHKAIAVSAVTPTLPDYDFYCSQMKRKRIERIQYDAPDPKRQKPNTLDKRSPIERLVDSLQNGHRRLKTKGWHREELGLGKGRNLNPKEKQQLLFEHTILHQHNNALR